VFLSYILPFQRPSVTRLSFNGSHFFYSSPPLKRKAPPMPFELLLSRASFPCTRDKTTPDFFSRRNLPPPPCPPFFEQRLSHLNPERFQRFFPPAYQLKVPSWFRAFDDSFSAGFFRGCFFLVDFLPSDPSGLGVIETISHFLLIPVRWLSLFRNVSPNHCVMPIPPPCVSPCTPLKGPFSFFFSRIPRFDCSPGVCS